MALKTDGFQCVRPANRPPHPDAPHLHFCAIHSKCYNRHVASADGIHHTVGNCHKFLDNRWCPNVAVPDGVQCEFHDAQTQRLVNRQLAQNAERLAIQATLGIYHTQNPIMTWQEVAQHVWRREDLHPDVREIIARRYFADTTNELTIVFWDFWTGVRFGDLRRPQRLTALAAIAADRQNVHTQVVSEQTNAGLELFLAREVKGNNKRMRTPDWLAAKWLPQTYGPWNKVSHIVNDMYRWYTQPSCRTPNDFLYKKALDGLFLTIKIDTKDEDIKRELYKRVFEECSESVGLCCDGHITRLCNVMVGFHDVFQSPISLGEQIQNEMARISNLDIIPEEKRIRAMAFFDGLKVPMEARMDWIDAF